MITGNVRGVEGVRAKLASAHPKAMGAIERTVKTETLNLVRVIKLKLSDSLVNVRTGRLRRSINAQFEKIGDSTYHGIAGTNVKYARPLDQGFDGTVSVPQHNVKAFQRLQSTAFGKPIEPRMVNVRAHVVKAHSMHMKIKARHFMGSSLEENQPRIMTNLRKALAEAMK